jgi:chloramphenicol 3-O phosphotransferase
MSTDLIVLNGGSSSGKSTIARCLQGILTRPWLLFGVDDLVEAIPQQGIEDGSLIRFHDDGKVEVGHGWRVLEASWYLGMAAIAASGSGVILDEVFLDGGRSQQRLQAAFVGLDVLWVGVQCDSQVAAAREALRPDRVPGMAKSQAAVVHEGVVYDVIVDTSHASSEACAAKIISGIPTLA